MIFNTILGNTVRINDCEVVIPGDYMRNVLLEMKNAVEVRLGTLKKNFEEL